MANQPFCSIVIPALNEELDLRECLSSLLDQTYPRERYEIIVVDNGTGVRISVETLHSFYWYKIFHYANDIALRFLINGTFDWSVEVPIILILNDLKGAKLSIVNLYSLN